MSSVNLSARTRKTLETARIMLDHWDPDLAEHGREVAQDLARFTPHHDGVTALPRLWRGVGDTPSPIDPIEAELWYWAGRLHDIGKIAIAAVVLNKPGAYTPAERRVVRRHARIGADLLRRIDAPELVVQAAEFHHEWWNGSGYPHGLRGEAIPYIARVLALVDAYQAMTHPRSYRPAYTPEQARLEIERLAGIQFDPAVVQAYFASALETEPCAY